MSPRFSLDADWVSSIRVHPSCARLILRIVNQSGKPISPVAKAMGLTESALRNWVKQAQINCQSNLQGQLTSAERKELHELRRDLKRVRLECDFLKKVATCFAKLFDSRHSAMINHTLSNIVAETAARSGRSDRLWKCEPHSG